jgi:cell division protein FtsQ
MPRLSATPVAIPPRPAAKGKLRRNMAPPDRLSQRVVFWRRVRRGIWPAFCVLLVLLLLGALHMFYKAVVDAGPVPSPVAWVRDGFIRASAAAGLRISNVEILGAPAIEIPALQQVVGVRPGDPSFGVSLTAVKTRVEAWGPVQTAIVRRELPGTLVVSITERTALAILEVQGAGAPVFSVIDEHGNVVPGQDGAAAWRRQPNLLLVSGADAPQTVPTLIAELKTVPEVQARVSSAQRVDGLRWNLILKDQAVVKLPVDNEAAAIAELNSLQTSMQLLDRPVEMIDLRIAGKLILRPYPTPDAHLAQGATK